MARFLALAATAFLVAAPPARGQVPAPLEHFGFEIGSDRNLADWTDALERDGWVIDPATRTIVNPWLVEHRFAPVASLRRADDGREVPWFATNVVVVARRPA